MVRITTYSFILALILGMTASAQTYPGYEITVDQLGSTVNSSGNDYAPFVTDADSILYFTSYRSNDSRGKADVFLTRRTPGGWASATNADESFNTNENEGALSIAADGRTVAFASERKGGFGDADIYIGTMDHGRIVEIHNLGSTVNTSAWESQPTISGDGRTIFFASNRSGGFGKTDIWMTRRNDDGLWSAPKNLGPAINTAGDERSPYVTPDGGTLYISSNGMGGFGGYDIFMSNDTGSAWTTPKNLGAPINSAGDELFFFAPKAWDRFFVSSDRDGGRGGLDIYSGTPNVFGGGMFRLAVSVRDSLSGDPLAGVVSIIDNQSGQTVAFISTSALSGDYIQPLPVGRTYSVIAQVPGYFNRRIEIANTEANTTREARFNFSSIPLADYDLGKYNVPFFVTGYYRPNTPTNLDALMREVNGSLSSATYIERFPRGSQLHRKYQEYSQIVERLFDSVYQSGVRDILPAFVANSRPDEVIEIVVTGYADPQPFGGRYVEDETQSFFDVSGRRYTVATGDEIGNMELSGLRAAFAAEHLDELFSDAAATGHPEYARMKSQGRIVYHYIAGGVSDDIGDYAVQRRIHIAISRRARGNRSAQPLVFDSNNVSR